MVLRLMLCLILFNVNDGFNALVAADVVYQELWSENARARLNFNKSITKSYVAYNFSQKRRLETLTTNIGADTTTIDPHNLHQLQLGTDLAITKNYTVGVRNILSFSDENLMYNSLNSINMDRKSNYTNLYNNLIGAKWRWITNFDLTVSDDEKLYDYNNFTYCDQDNSYRFYRLSSFYTYNLTSAFKTQVGAILNRSKYSSTTNELDSLYKNCYKEQNYSAYASLLYQKDKVDANAGVQVNVDNRTNDEIEQNFLLKDKLWSYQPFFHIGYNFAKNHRTSLGFNTYYNRPSYRDLLPYLSSSSSILPRLGNPYLLNSTRYNFALSYSFMRAAFVEFNFSYEDNPIVEFIKLYDGAVVLSKTNLEVV